MNKANFIDLDTLVKINSKVWIIDKNNPSVPIVKIEKSEFNLIKSGIYKNLGNKIEFNGDVFWLPTDLINKLKIKIKNINVDFSNLAISMQEFFNRGIIDENKFTINHSIIKLLNKEDDIYIICSRQTYRSYNKILNSIEQELLEEHGIKIKNFYFLSETFYNKNEDDVLFKKSRLLIQHLTGYKTDGYKFIDMEIDRYDVIEYYDINPDINQIVKNINDFLNLFYNVTEGGLKDVIKENILDYQPRLVVNQITDNKMNPILRKATDLKISNIIKTFKYFI